MDGKRWEKIREKLQGGYKWAVQVAKRKNRRERGGYDYGNKSGDVGKGRKNTN